MKRILLFSTLFLGVIIFTFNACKKREPDTETQSAVDNDICESEFTNATNTANEFGIKENGVKSLFDTRALSCPSIIIDTIDARTFPVTMTIDYGTGCVDTVDGKTRKGKIVAVFSDRWRTPGARIKMTFVDYYVKNPGSSSFVQYTCDSAVLINNSAAGANIPSYTTKVVGGRCISPSWELQWSSTRTLTQTEGANTPFNRNDDVYKYEGSSNGVNRDGKSYTVNITSPIIKAAKCAWIQKGTIELTPDGLATRTIDYGNGTCDNQATLTINGNKFEFTMN